MDGCQRRKGFLTSMFTSFDVTTFVRLFHPSPASNAFFLLRCCLSLAEIINCHCNRRFKVTRKSYTVKKLREGQEYEFRVTAENDVGQSAPSQSVFSKYGSSNSLFCIY